MRLKKTLCVLTAGTMLLSTPMQTIPIQAMNMEQTTDQVQVSTITECLKKMQDVENKLKHTMATTKSLKSATQGIYTLEVKTEKELPNVGATDIIYGPNDIAFIYFTNQTSANEALARLQSDGFEASMSINIEPERYEEQEDTSKVLQFLNNQNKSGKLPTKDVLVAVIDTGFNEEYLGNEKDRVLWDKGTYLIGDGLSEDKDHFHGSFVTDIILKSTNSNVKVLPIRALLVNSTVSTSKISLAVLYALEHGANVINMSLGGEGSSVSLDAAMQACKERGVKVIASAGNNGKHMTNYIPASCDGVCAVASIDKDTKERSNFSNYGDYVDLTAVGQDIMTTMGTTTYKLEGTSFSTPCVTAAVANLMSYGYENPVETLEYYAEDIDEKGKDQNTGYGLANLSAVKENQFDPDKRYSDETVTPSEPSDSSSEPPSIDFDRPYNLFEAYDNQDLKIEVNKEKAVYGQIMTEDDFKLYLYGEELVRGRDYSIEVSDRPVEVGMNTVHIKGIGKYWNEFNMPYYVKAVTLPKAFITSVTYNDLHYKYPAVKFTGKTLKVNKDYTVKYHNNRYAGTATAVITGKGNYSGKQVVKYKVKKMKLPKVTASDTIYKTSGYQTPRISFRSSCLGGTLTEGKDYTVTYKNNKKPGIATVIVKGKNSCYGTRTAKFKIKRAK